MKLFWTGTDVLMLNDTSMRKPKTRVYYFVFRVLVRFIERFIEYHYCDAEHLADELREFGFKKKIEVFRDKLNYYQKFPKASHGGFNVIYYNPIRQTFGEKFKNWLYGIDIVNQVKNLLPEINFIELDGTKDMSEIYPITDFMIRPNRHDGSSRIRQECEIQGIPYYWTHSNPNVNDCVKAIEDEYKRQVRLQQQKI